MKPSIYAVIMEP